MLPMQMLLYLEQSSEMYCTTSLAAPVRLGSKSAGAGLSALVGTAFVQKRYA